MILNNKKKYFLIIGIIIFLDQISKFVIKTNFNIYDNIKIFKGFFQLFYAPNSGAIWGIFHNQSNTIIPKIITIISVIAVLILIFFFLKVKSNHKLELTSLSFIIGGAIGNIIDRIYQGFVVDFLDFYIKDYHWPTFNIADSFITIGVVILAISIWKGEKSLKT